jgi:hypothetical protein
VVLSCNNRIDNHISPTRSTMSINHVTMPSTTPDYLFSEHNLDRLLSKYPTMSANSHSQNVRAAWQAKPGRLPAMASELQYEQTKCDTVIEIMAIPKDNLETFKSEVSRVFEAGKVQLAEVFEKKTEASLAYDELCARLIATEQREHDRQEEGADTNSSLITTGSTKGSNVRSGVSEGAHSAKSSALIYSHQPASISLAASKFPLFSPTSTLPWQRCAYNSIFSLIHSIQPPSICV